MRRKEVSGRQYGLWVGAAMIAPVLHTAAGCTWPAVLLVSAVCLLICLGMNGWSEDSTGVFRLVQRIWACVVLARMMQWTELLWPDHPNTEAAPLILLLLAAWLASRGEVQAGRIGCVLFWPVLILLGAVILSGLREVRLDDLRPTIEMADAGLVTVLLLPMATIGRKERQGRVLTTVAAAGILISAASAGILSPAVSTSIAAPVWELGRSIQIFGVVERFESVVAAAMTLGYFAAFTWLLPKEKGWTWGGAAIAALLYSMGWIPDSRVLALGSILIWVVLIALNKLKRILKKL